GFPRLPDGLQAPIRFPSTWKLAQKSAILAAMARTRASVVAALVLAGALACKERAPAATAGAEARFAAVADRFLAAHFRFNPTSGTSAGLHEHDAALEDRTPAAVAARVAELRAFGAELDALPAADLGSSAAIDLQLLRLRTRADL